MRPFLPLLCCLLFAGLVSAQDKNAKKPGDVMIEKYLAGEADKLSAKVLDGAKTLDEWKAKRPRLYQEYMDMLGLWPIPEKTPLKAVKTGEIEAHGVIVESVHFQSKPGLYVTANVYRPKGKAGTKQQRLPAIVYVCGHSGRGRDGNKTAFQDHGFWFANNGYVCIVLDTLQLGEIAGLHHGTYGRVPPRWWWHSIGYSPAAVECWNGVRAIDYLVTRPDVDPDKIGVTGISGGGAATFWIAAADERVKVAVPVSGMADLESYVKNKVINGHCDCMFLYNTYQWDWTTIAALVAPRPLLFANSDRDPIFPMDANRRVIAKLQKLYGMYATDARSREAAGCIAEYVSAGGHDYRPDLRKAIFHFFNVHLKRQPTAVVEDSAKYTPLEGKKLRVFPTDADLPKDAINARVDEAFIPMAKVTLPAKGKFGEWKTKRIKELKDHTFRNKPDLEPQILGFRTPSSMNPYFRTVSEKNMEILKILMMTKIKEPMPRGKGNTLVLLDEIPKGIDRLNVPIAPRWAVPHCDWHNCWGLYVRGVGEAPTWTVNSPPNYVERSHLLLGRTVEQARVWDVVGTIQGDNAGEKDKERHSWSLVGRGKMGIIAAYAALLEPSIKEVVIVDPPKSHKEGPHFLNVLRVLDIPEALGLLAPMPLTIVGGQDPAFDRTAEIYRLAGAADKLKRQ